MSYIPTIVRVPLGYKVCVVSYIPTIVRVPHLILVLGVFGLFVFALCLVFNVAGVYGLSILYCSFGILCSLYYKIKHTTIAVSLEQFLVFYTITYLYYFTSRGHRGRGHLVVGFTTTYAISAYHH